MNADQADLVLAFESSTFVAGVYVLHKQGWPSTIVVMRDDSAYALGTVTGIIVRTLPHRDRSHIGVAGEERLRELWIPLSSSLLLTPKEREAAVARAQERTQNEVVPLEWHKRESLPAHEPAPVDCSIASKPTTQTSCPRSRSHARNEARSGCRATSQLEARTFESSTIPSTTRWKKKTCWSRPMGAVGTSDAQRTIA